MPAGHVSRLRPRARRAPHRGDFHPPRVLLLLPFSTGQPNRTSHYHGDMPQQEGPSQPDVSRGMCFPGPVWPICPPAVRAAHFHVPARAPPTVADSTRVATWNERNPGRQHVPGPRPANQPVQHIALLRFPPGHLWTQHRCPEMSPALFATSLVPSIARYISTLLI